MENESYFLSTAEKVELKALIKTALETGTSLLTITKRNPRFKYKSVLYWKDKFFPDETNIKDYEKSTRIKNLLIKGFESGLNLTDLQKKHPDISMGSFQYWNRKHQIYPIEDGVIYTEELILEILEFAKNNGVKAAATEYKVDEARIYEWNVIHKIFNTTRVTKTYTESYKISKLRQAYRYNKANKNNYGVKFVCLKYDISHTNMYEWNKKYKILPKRCNTRGTLLSDAELDYIAEKSKSFKTVKSLAKDIGREQITVKKALELRNIICDRYGIHHPAVNENHNQSGGR
ncbi:hypothetical protein LJC18_05155 [Lachnospiraceae bacterium OttesenSCG-928-E19]|nr:hypothetical protein [Lachnospiraceae bacterium OttesenSCG-928-E19]